MRRNHMKHCFLNKLVSVGLVCIIMAQLCSNGMIVFASEKISINNECVTLNESHIAQISSYLVENITEKYEGVYSFENIDITIYNEHEDSSNIIVDVEVLADMILVRSPLKSPYVKGMTAEIQTIKNSAEKNIAMSAMNEYIQNANQYYNVPVLTGFCYRVYVPKTAMMSSDVSDDYEFYHRVDVEDGVILNEVNDNERMTEIKTIENGKEFISSVISETSELARSLTVTYGADDAVAYAVAHATDIPEYSAANGNGSDCANFVSKCVNAGGIPQDYTGGYNSGWYQGSLNWIRTGYNGQDGIVIYMQDKGYFDDVSSSSYATEGSIMYYNTNSHVAIVTLIDGSTIKYSHHSNVPKTSVYYVYDSSVDDVTFFVPQV